MSFILPPLDPNGIHLTLKVLDDYDSLVAGGMDPLEIAGALLAPEGITFSQKYFSWDYFGGRICCGVLPDADGTALVVKIRWRIESDGSDGPVYLPGEVAEWLG